MKLDEYRAAADKWLAGPLNNPHEKPENGKFAPSAVRILRSTDYIIQAPQSLIQLILFSSGYRDVEQLGRLYSELIDEITKTYPVVSPEQLFRDADYEE